MARKLEGFDPIFQKVTERAIAVAKRTKPGDDALIKIPCATRGQAMNVQMQLRQYWRALGAARDRGELGDPAYDPRGALANNAGMLSCRAAKGQPAVVEVVHRGQLTTARLLAQAIGDLGTGLAIAEAEPAPAAQNGPIPATSGAQEGLLMEFLEAEPKGEKA